MQLPNSSTQCCRALQYPLTAGATDTRFHAKIESIPSECDGKTLVTSKIYLHQAALHVKLQSGKRFTWGINFILLLSLLSSLIFQANFHKIFQINSCSGKKSNIYVTQSHLRSYCAPKGILNLLRTRSAYARQTILPPKTKLFFWVISSQNGKKYKIHS